MLYVVFVIKQIKYLSPERDPVTTSPVIGWTDPDVSVYFRGHVRSSHVHGMEEK